MLLLGKIALGLGSTVAVAGAYTFHQGVIRIDVDEFRSGGSHVHMWVPAAIVPTAMKFVPARHLRHAFDHGEARQAMPIVRAVFRELQNYPNTVFVDVTDGDQRVRVATEKGRLAIDVTESQENVHVRVPLTTVEDTIAQLERAANSMSVREHEMEKSRDKNADWDDDDPQ
jgi:hypothetical protein